MDCLRLYPKRVNVTPFFCAYDAPFDKPTGDIALGNGTIADIITDISLVDLNEGNPACRHYNAV